jgi:ParB family chromosome partitioning protein
MSHRDQCTDAACLNNKVGRYLARQLETKPKLVQISTVYGGRVEGSVLPRSRYIALHLSKSKGKQPLSPNEKPCKHMADAIVVEGLERGQTTKVCTEPSCIVHLPGRNNKAANEAQLAREREQRRKELEKRKLESTVRHRILAEVLRKVGAPLDRGDLTLVVNAILERTEPLRRETLARRHKMVDGSSSEVTYPQVQKGLQRLVRQLDESGLSKLIVEMVLLGSVESLHRMKPMRSPRPPSGIAWTWQRCVQPWKRSFPPSKRRQRRNKRKPLPHKRRSPRKRHKHRISR